MVIGGAGADESGEGVDGKYEEKKETEVVMKL